MSWSRPGAGAGTKRAELVQAVGLVLTQHLRHEAFRAYQRDLPPAAWIWGRALPQT